MYSDSTRTIQSARPSSHSPPETEGTQSEPMQVYNGGRSLLQVLVVDSREVHKGRVVVTLGVTHVFFQHVANVLFTIRHVAGPESITFQFLSFINTSPVIILIDCIKLESRIENRGYK